MHKFIKQHFREYLIYAGVFSFFINILMLTLPIYMMQTFDRVFSSRSNETLVMLTLAAVFALTISWALDLLRARLTSSAGVIMEEKLGHKALSGVIRHAARLEGKDHAQGLRDIAVLRNFLTGQSIFSLFDSPWLPFYLIIIFMFHPLLGAVATASALILFIMAVLNEKLTRPPLHEASQAARRSSRFIDASLRNAEVVSAMGMQTGVERRWSQLNAEVIALQGTASNRAALMMSTTKLFRMLIQIAMMAAGAWLVIDQHSTPGIMMAATLILSRALAPVESAIGTWKQFVEARESFDNLDKLLKTTTVEHGMELPSPKGHIKVDRLTFAAPGTNRLTLKGVSFDLAAGEVLGIIGPSAAGKSTLLRLLVGVWKPASGVVRLDGADVSTWAREHIGQFIGYLPQDVELFAGTVGENICRMGDADARGEEIVAAAQLAGVHEMILHLPKGYDTEIGEGGTVLSGGQRQRIALARAVFGNPCLVILDEPNANLDNEGEEALARTILNLKSLGTTLVIVTHKPSALGQADKMLVMRDGAVEMFGPRAEVIAKVTRPNTVPISAAGAQRGAGNV
jgi:PrtD family type I secretion system ABC transporter